MILAQNLTFIFFSEIWNLGQYCRQKQLEYHEKGMHCRRTCTPGSLLKIPLSDSSDSGPEAKRMKMFTDPDILSSNVAFFRAQYEHNQLPKLRLYAYAMKENIDQPKYETHQQDKLFRSILFLNGKKYASTYWEKNKKFAEQGAALVGMLYLGMIDESTLIENGSIMK